MFDIFVNSFWAALVLYGIGASLGIVAGFIWVYFKNRKSRK